MTLLIKESRIQSLQWAVLTFCSLGDFSDNSLLHLKKKSIYFYDIYFFILQDIKDTHPKVTIFYNMLLLVPNSGCQATVRFFFLPFF